MQSCLVEMGADFVEAEPFTEHIETDRTLCSGQNPASSVLLTQALTATKAGPDLNGTPDATPARRVA